MVNWCELEQRGWTCVSGITSRLELLRLAQSIGQPLLNPAGKLVKELIPSPDVDARRGTLSETYGNGVFPLHTDTAFWPVPARYVLLRAHGDIRRRTTILRFAKLFRNASGKVRTLAHHSIWLAQTAATAFYCSMKFSHSASTGWRYDSQCMSPANKAAVEIRQILGPLLACDRMECIDWNEGMVVVLSNWEVLHGRGPSPLSEGKRILERIYVTR
jgi:alpha-ketoglutarate-dependent taurine dioxygenase